MSGAWETPPNVLVGMLHVETTTIAWSFGFRNLIIPGYIPPFPVAGVPYDMGRNMMCWHALNIGADYVFMLDTDVIPPRDTIPRLISHRQPIVSGLYNRRSPPWSIPVAQKDGQWFTNFKKGGTYEVDVVGAGCLLLERGFLIDMLKRFPIDPKRGKIWFDWRSDMPESLPREERMSEDFSMCRQARMHGYKVYLDTSIECIHQGLADSTYQLFKPAEVRVLT